MNRTRLPYALLLLLLLASACGIKSDIPTQIPSTEILGDDAYEVNYRWLITGVTDLLVHRRSDFFYVIQHQDSLIIYPSYRREDLVSPAPHKNLFRGLDTPRLLADGIDAKARLWVFDDGDGKLKGFDGSRGIDTLYVEVEYRDPAWLSVTAIAADNAGRVFVADRLANKIYRYTVEVDGNDIELDPAGELTWTSQQTGARVRDIAFGAGKLILLDDALMSLQLLDPAGVEVPVFAFLDNLLIRPTALSADAEHCFVVDMGDVSVWEIPLGLDASEALKVNTHTKVVLESPVAVTLNDGKAYVADETLGMVIDYEKRQ
jgi:hypothetical protein